jgi:hypothetical protein
MVWALGIPTKYDHGAVAPKSRVEIVTRGPIYFVGWFLFFFASLYVTQLAKGRIFEAKHPEVYFCPACHTPQFEHERKCGCAAKLEPLENWKWV